MGLLDTVLGGLMGNSGSTGGSPLQSILGELLSGGGSQQQGTAPGIGGLVQRFEQAGLGSVANSWVGNGPNQAVQPSQLQQVFGQGQVNQWAQQTGMQPQDLLGQLANFLPHAVDRMTPNGSVPAGGEANPFDETGVRA